MISGSMAVEVRLHCRGSWPFLAATKEALKPPPELVLFAEVDLLVFVAVRVSRSRCHVLADSLQLPLASLLGDVEATVPCNRYDTFVPFVFARPVLAGRQRWPVRGCCSSVARRWRRTGNRDLTPGRGLLMHGRGADLRHLRNELVGWRRGSPARSSSRCAHWRRGAARRSSRWC
jgi:hypothetical protein